VTQSGHAVINVPSGTPTHFDANTRQGIFVDMSGSIDVTGVVANAATGTGTVTANGNFQEGVAIFQGPGPVPRNNITGLVSFGTTNGNGLLFLGGSSVKLRSSASLGHQGSGVVIGNSATVGGTNDISQIDLGTALDFGHNTFQADLGAGNNATSGICIELAPDSGTLLAEGNVFRGTDCAATAGSLRVNATGCGNGMCTAGVCDLGIVAAGNKIDVSQCTYP
jgi:hypothetical protein